MTNKEAIEELRDIKKEIDDVFIFTGDKKIEALEIAIKALEDKTQGEWVWLGDNPNPNHKWSCNKCGRGVKEQENFCPKCGAKMES